MVDLFHQSSKQENEQNSWTVGRLYKLHQAVSTLLATEVLKYWTFSQDQDIQSQDQDQDTKNASQDQDMSRDFPSLTTTTTTTTRIFV